MKPPRWAQHQKRWFAKWHLYLGIIAGAILVIVGLTGSILVFQDEIDMALNKDFFETMKGQKRYTIEEVVPIVKQKYPDKEFEYVMYADVKKPNATFRFFDFHTESEFFTNPYTAALCGKRMYESSFIHIVMDIHRTLLVPAAGAKPLTLAEVSGGIPPGDHRHG